MKAKKRIQQQEAVEEQQRELNTTMEERFNIENIRLQSCFASPRSGESK